MTGNNSDAASSPGKLFRPRRIGHVNFWVNDSYGVADFYRDIVGINEVYRREAIKAVFMSNGNTYHDVAFMDLDHPRGVGKSPGLHHFSLELTCEKDLVDGYKACGEQGYAFDFTISADVTNSAYGSDPDGNRFEVYADITPDWRSERSGAVSSGGRGWVPGETPPLTQSFVPTNPQIKPVDNAVFQPLRVSHAVLITRDHKAMVRHYTEVVGLRPIAGGGDRRFVVLGGTCGEETLTLYRGEGMASGLHHTGFQLRDEAALEHSKNRLLRLGMTFEVDTDHPSRRSLFVLDPAGQRLQFYVDRSEAYAGWDSLDDNLALFVV